MSIKETLESVEVRKTLSYDGTRNAVGIYFFSQYPIDYGLVNISPDKAQEYMSIMSVDCVVYTPSKMLLDDLALEIYADSLNPEVSHEWFVEDNSTLDDFIEQDEDTKGWSLGFTIKQFVDKKNVTKDEFYELLKSIIDEFSVFVERFMEQERVKTFGDER